MRAGGILLPITSLPSKYGIGCFSKEAYEFVDFLAEAGQKYWQILPLGPTSYGDSPYQSFSTFAGNPYFIDLDALAEEGVLTEEECGACDFGSDPEQVDYGKIYKSRFLLLRKAYERSCVGENATGFGIMLFLWRSNSVLEAVRGMNGRRISASAGDMPWNITRQSFIMRLNFMNFSNIRFLNSGIA